MYTVYYPNPILEIVIPEKSPGNLIHVIASFKMKNWIILNVTYISRQLITLWDSVLEDCNFWIIIWPISGHTETTRKKNTCTKRVFKKMLSQNTVYKKTKLKANSNHIYWKSAEFFYFLIVNVEIYNLI